MRNNASYNSKKRLEYSNTLVLVARNWPNQNWQDLTRPNEPKNNNSADKSIYKNNHYNHMSHIKSQSYELVGYLE